MDGEEPFLSGYLVEDFTLKEIKQLTVHAGFASRRAAMEAMFDQIGLSASSSLGVERVGDPSLRKVPTVGEAADFVQSLVDKLGK